MIYTINIQDGRYVITKESDCMHIMRYGQPWPADEALSHPNLVKGLVNRVIELELAISDVLNGTLDGRGERTGNGMNAYVALGPDAESWRDQLAKVLEQRA